MLPKISIIIPCFNEAPGIRHLSDRLRPALRALASTAEVELVLVDDGSRDGTARRLEAEFGGVKSTVIVRHEENRGITAAIHTGFAAANGEVLCTMDSDMSYDPMILGRLIAPILAGQADVVSASPYHPGGAVVNVPAWRLALSRAASWIYRQLLPVPLYTVTSCCRAYRASILSQLTFTNPGFLGVSEMLAAAVLARLRIVEVPARLTRRRYGVSKMKTASVLRDHLGLIWRLAADRWRLRAAEIVHGSER